MTPMKFRCILEGVGAALMLLFYYRGLMEPSNLALFYHGLPVGHLVGGYLVDVLASAVLVALLLFSLEYLPPMPRRAALALFAGLMLWRIVDLAIAIQTSNWLTACWSEVRKQSLIGIVLVLWVFVLLVPRMGLPVVRAIRLAVAAFAFCGLWIIPQLIHIAFVKPPDTQAASAHLSEATYKGSDQRIIWILFDELSYDQTFDHPFPGIDLPNFRRLRAASVSYSKLKPAGFHTQEIIPSLFSGIRINGIRSTVGGGLRYKDEFQNRWFAYDPEKTLFALAKSKGWSSGVDEWTFPYCRVFAAELDTCSWEPSILLPTELYGASEEKSVLANAAVLPRMLLDIGASRAPSAQATNIRNYRDIMAHAETLIDDSQISFVFLHVPVPHPPGIYDRQRHLLRQRGTYLDNLVLADDTLGLLLKGIDATRESGRTIVIVSSDHSWRISLYRNLAGWSAEEERACGGQFDDRPVLLIHFPGQRMGADVNAAVPEMLEHDMIAGMLRGEIQSPEDLYRLNNERGSVQ
jgi:hypothetical protein